MEQEKLMISLSELSQNWYDGPKPFIKITAKTTFGTEVLRFRFMRSPVEHKPYHKHIKSRVMKRLVKRHNNKEIDLYSVFPKEAVDSMIEYTYLVDNETLGINSMMSFQPIVNELAKQWFDFCCDDETSKHLAYFSGLNINEFMAYV